MSENSQFVSNSSSPGRPSPKAPKDGRKGRTQSPSAIKALGQRAQAILHRLLDQEQQPEAIANIVWLQTRENVSPEAITRYASRYRKRREAELAAKRKTDALVALARKDGVEISDLLRSVLIEKLSQKNPRDPSLRNMDVLKLEAAERQRSSLDLRREMGAIAARQKERELDIKERGAALNEKRFKWERQKVRLSFEQLEQKAATGRSLTPEDIRNIKAIYGIYDDTTDQNEAGNGAANESEPRP